MKNETALAKVSGSVLGGAYRLCQVLNRMGISRFEPVKSLKPKLRTLLLGSFTANQDCILVQVEGHALFIPKPFLDHYFFSRYEPCTATLFRQSVRRGCVVLDIGAHIGLYSLLAARTAGPNGEVFAFEPEPDSFSVLKENVRVNGYQNIHAFQQAVYSQPGRRPLMLLESSNSHSFYPYAHPFAASAGTCWVDCVTVDSFMAHRPVDVVKIDVEGAEIAVLEGMRRTIKENRNIVLFVELNPTCLRAAGYAPGDLLRVLRSAGFSVTLIDEKAKRMERLRGETVCVPMDLPLWYANLYCTRE